MPPNSLKLDRENNSSPGNTGHAHGIIHIFPCQRDPSFNRNYRKISTVFDTLICQRLAPGLSQTTYRCEETRFPKHKKRLTQPSVTWTVFFLSCDLYSGSQSAAKYFSYTRSDWLCHSFNFYRERGEATFSHLPSHQDLI
jgi:hypothetical protein